MSRLWLVRHGPTHCKTFVGWRDVAADLSDQPQVDRVSRYLPAGGVVVASDLQRASATADAIAGPRHRLPDRADLREFNFGLWDGMAFADVAHDDPALSRQFWESPGDTAPPGGESWNMVAARVDAAVDSLIQAYTGHDIIIVAHIGVIMTQIKRAMRSTASRALGHRIDNLSVTDIMIAQGNWKIGTINHLP